MRYLILIFSLFIFSACSSNKPKIEDNNITTKREVETQVENRLDVRQRIVEKELNIYLQALNNFDIDAIVDMTYPKLFTVIDGEIFKRYLTTMMNSKDILLKKYKTTTLKLGKVTKFSNGTQFAQVTYRAEAKIILLNKKLYRTEKSMNFLYDVFIHKYGRENVSIDLKSRTLTIIENKKLVVLKVGDEKWKFLEDNPEYRRYFPHILPNEVLKYLK